MSRAWWLPLILIAGCSKPPEPPAAAPTSATTAEPPPTPALPAASNDAERLEAILKPMEWYVNDMPDDEKPRIVAAPIVRSRFEKKTEGDFSKLSQVLAETGIPVIIDLGGYDGTPATADWVKSV